MKITLAAFLFLLTLASADTFVQPLEFAYVDPEQEDHLFFAETAPASPTTATAAPTSPAGSTAPATQPAPAANAAPA